MLLVAGFQSAPVLSLHLDLALQQCGCDLQKGKFWTGKHISATVRGSCDQAKGLQQERWHTLIALDSRDFFLQIQDLVPDLTYSSVGL